MPYPAEFEGKIAIVTGTSGIGRAAALRLAADGARTLAIGVDAALNAELEASGAARGLDRLSVALADAADPASLGPVMERFIAEAGGLDVIVNAAAIHPYGTVETTDAATFARCMAVNVGSIHLTGHFGIAAMRRRGGGSIVNLASVQGHACQPNVAAYVASKGAIHALTRAMAMDHARDRIRVNSVSPGSVRTPILALAARTFDGPDADVEAVFRRFGDAHPIGRIGEPEEIAEAIAYLASDRAGFMTGGDLLIDGGLKAGLGVR
jgi:NAD(P)-dependent dehydrogenase (short-subunit alcohol dehydrogenase family)